MSGNGLIGRERRADGLCRQPGRWKLLCMLLLAFVASTCSVGCMPNQQHKPLAPATVVMPPYQRFIPIAKGQGFLSFPYWAFDTKTGQLCKTWGWQSETKASKNAMQSGDSSDLTGLDAAAYGTQTCEQLWKAYPDNSK